MHVRVWSWRRLGFRCRLCGAGWPRWRMVCVDEPRPVSVGAGLQPFGWNEPTVMLETFRLTRGQVWRGNGGRP